MRISVSSLKTIVRRALVESRLDDVETSVEHMTDDILLVKAFKQGANSGVNHDPHWDMRFNALPKPWTKDDLIGSVLIRRINPGSDKWQGKNLYVHRSYRRMGIATAMYSAAEAQGVQLVPDDEQSAAGEKLWSTTKWRS